MVGDRPETRFVLNEVGEFTHRVLPLFQRQGGKNLRGFGFKPDALEGGVASHDQVHQTGESIADLLRREGFPHHQVTVFTIKRDLLRSDVFKCFDTVPGRFRDVKFRGMQLGA